MLILRPCFRQIRPLSFACLCLALVLPAHGEAPLQLKLSRGAYYRGETTWISIDGVGDVKGDLKVDLSGMPVAVDSKSRAGFRLDTAPYRCDAYVLRASVEVEGKSVASGTAELSIAPRPNPDRMPMWLWPHKASLDAAASFDDESRRKAQYWMDLGFNNIAFGEAPSPVLNQWFDFAMKKGVTVCLMPPGGFAIPPDANKEDPDLLFKGPDGKVIRDGKFANPFHPQVQRHQEKLMHELMLSVRDRPQCTTAFFNSEIVDLLECNGNDAGKRLLQSQLAIDPAKTGKPNFVQSGVLADDDAGYLYHKFVFKRGNGFAAANQGVAEDIHQLRPDILTINDPFRSWALLDGFPGLDVISTWTYINPDPKLFLSTEILRAAARPAGQEILHTVTLLNYPGELAPTDRWMMMDDGRLKVATWLNLSRAPRMLGYYFSSACDPFGALADDLKTKIEVNDFEVPKSGFDTLRTLSREVIEPLGPVIRKLDLPKRRVAVLSSEASRLYGKSPTLLGAYSNMQVMHMYTVLAMAQIPADIVFDETVERFGLDDYDVLVLPKCDVLTESVYKQVLAFQKRGGVLVADQYLGPELPGAIRVDFDFTYRDKVTAMAINKNQGYAKWNDQLKPGSAELREVKGVTALDDQKIMESYAKALCAMLDQVVTRDVDCADPSVLVNRLSAGGADYLVVVNDKREYGPRLGQYKAVLEKIVPQRAAIRLNRWRGQSIHVYDLVSHKRLDVQELDGDPVIHAELGEIGGTLLAISPDEPSQLQIRSASSAAQTALSIIQVEVAGKTGMPLAGPQPITVTLKDPSGRAHELSGHYAAMNGVLSLPFDPAVNDPVGAWSIHAEHLGSGLVADATIQVDARRP